jgi:hypothetical protein
MRAMLAGCLLAFVMVGAELVVAQAPRELPAKVLVVLAKEEPGPVDPALRDEPALRRPPFNAFRSMEILEKPEVRLQVGHPSELTLPNGRKLQLTVERVMPDGRFRVKVSINRPNQSDYLPLLQVVASPGDPFFVAGQSHQGGTLVVGVRIGEKPAK